MYLYAHGDWRNGWYDNNHLGVIFGAVGLAALALDQDDPIFNQTARDSIAWYRQKAATRVRDYLDASYPGEGAGIEGILYAMYGMNLALPYALATERLRTVAQGYDPLPASMRVDAPRNAYQAPTWLYCEQLPFNPCGGTPLNDTARPALRHQRQLSRLALAHGVLVRAVPQPGGPLLLHDLPSRHDRRRGGGGLRLSGARPGQRSLRHPPGDGSGAGVRGGRSQQLRHSPRLAGGGSVSDPRSECARPWHVLPRARHHLLPDRGPVAESGWHPGLETRFLPDHLRVPPASHLPSGLRGRGVATRSRTSTTSRSSSPGSPCSTIRGTPAMGGPRPSSPPRTACTRSASAAARGRASRSSGPWGARSAR